MLVAISDRSPESLSALRLTIEQSGIQVVTFASAEPGELLAFVAAHHPDVVLFDIPWPYEANAAVYREVRRDPRAAGTRWIALSRARSVVRGLLESGEQVLLGKPFDSEELMEEIGRALERGAAGK